MVEGRGRLVCRIYDIGDTAVDRYTIAFKGYRSNDGRSMIYPYLASSEYPFHPQGFGQHGELVNIECKGKHLGKRIEFEALPDAVKKFILQSI
jgi:hypothetical protein